jgi:flavin-binding protein dodecin
MSTLKVIEVLAESPDGWEEAATKAVEEAVGSLRHVRSIYIKNFEATVDGGRISMFRVNAKISFVLEDGR